MSQPTVTAVMLCSPGRNEYHRQALQAFHAQTYTNARLAAIPALPGVTIGAMRNRVNELANGEIIVHFDDDDWSHPNRIAEQVALLQATGADCVGYNEMLFWRQNDAPHCAGEEPDTWTGHQAWLYSNPNPRYALGTSLCYWRHVWESFKFQNLQHGEDTEWIRYRHCVGVSGVPSLIWGRNALEMLPEDLEAVPAMIARIHAGNSSSAYDPIEMARHNVLPSAERQWSRVPEWDKVCREVMER